MRDLDDIQAENPDQGFQFPGVLEITVLGRADAALEPLILEVLGRHGLAMIPGSLRPRPSREGTYVSITLGFDCPDRAHYDALHAALRAEPAVRWTI